MFDLLINQSMSHSFTVHRKPEHLKINTEERNFSSSFDV